MLRQTLEPQSVAVPLPGPPPLTIRALDAGPRDAALALMCIHGVGGAKEQWLPQVTHFAEHARIVAPDLRGHGQTPVTPGPYGMNRIGGDLQQLIARLDLRTPLVVLGHSYGGAFALDLALTCPELVSHVVLIGVAAQFNYGLLFKLATQAPVPGHLLELARRIIFPRKFHAPATVMRALMRDALLPWRGWERLGEIRQPVLAIAGKLDVVAPPLAVERMVRQLPRGQLRIVARVKHKIQLQRPDTTNRLIEQFLAGTHAYIGNH